MTIDIQLPKHPSSLWKTSQYACECFGKRGTKGVAAAASSVLKSFGFRLLFLAVYVVFLRWEPVSPENEKY